LRQFRIVGVNVADEVVARSAARNTPARATVETRLASPDYKIEIMVVAAR
jgi:enamine deaminase RidA (YjgF/YER057c/UK114 family)